MTDNLVERLRAIDRDIILRRFDPEMSFDGMTAHEAADRIEKLEAALRFYADNESYKQVWDDQFRTWVTYVLSDNGRHARKALEVKDD